MSLLMTEGLLDLQTPPATAEALAAAGTLPILSPTAHLSTAHSLSEDGIDQSPAILNRKAYDGTKVTAGLAQFGDEDHFAIFYNETAADLYLKFLSTALDGGTPLIPEH